MYAIRSYYVLLWQYRFFRLAHTLDKQPDFFKIFLEPDRIAVNILCVGPCATVYAGRSDSQDTIDDILRRDASSQNDRDFAGTHQP